jgi:membrane protein implicated in regulation of membrane protease activity
MRILGKVLSFIIIGAVLIGLFSLTAVVFINIGLFLLSFPIWPYGISIAAIIVVLVLWSWKRSRRRR